MAVKLHRCPLTFAKLEGHPCWRVEKALIDAGVGYERVTGPLPRGRRTTLVERTGQSRYPAIELEDGTWYHEDSKRMAETIRSGKLRDREQSQS